LGLVGLVTAIGRANPFALEFGKLAAEGPFLLVGDPLDDRFGEFSPREDQRPAAAIENDHILLTRCQILVSLSHFKPSAGIAVVIDRLHDNPSVGQLVLLKQVRYGAEERFVAIIKQSDFDGVSDRADQLEGQGRKFSAGVRTAAEPKKPIAAQVVGHYDYRQNGQRREAHVQRDSPSLSG